MDLKEQGTFFEGFTECCKVEGYDPSTVIPDLSSYPEHLRPALNAVAKLLIFNDASNKVDGKPWKPDYNNYEEEKHFPYADMEVTASNPSGFGLLGVFCVSAYSGVGSRLSYRDRALAKHVFKVMEAEYKAFMVIP